MKKFLKLIFFTTLLVSSSFAGEVFMGGETGWFYSNAEILYNKNGTANTSKDNSSAFDLGLKIGYSTDNHRIYGAYNYGFGGKYRAKYYYGDGKFELKETIVHKYLIGYNFTPQIYDVWRGLIGIYGGLAVGEREDDFLFGFARGAKIGALYQINNNNEMEFGLKAEDVGLIEFNGSQSIFSNYGLYFGYNVKF